MVRGKKNQEQDKDSCYNYLCPNCIEHIILVSQIIKSLKTEGKKKIAISEGGRLRVWNQQTQTIILYIGWRNNKVQVNVHRELYSISCNKPC